jgi:hypothetical protein
MLGWGSLMDAGRLTPSGFHDRAWRRAPKHDDMQREFLEFLRARPTIIVPPNAISARQVEGEYPLVRNGQVISFVDAIEILDVGFCRTVTLFEIKPIIETVYGVVRQAKAQLELASNCFANATVTLNVVVPHDEFHMGEDLDD